MSQTNYIEKKYVVSIVILLRSFLLVLEVFLHLDIHHENIVLLSTITKQYFYL